MSTDLMIPESNAVPAHIQKMMQQAKQINDDAGAGISGGMPARVKFNGKQFDMVDSNGEGKQFPLDQMVKGPDNNYYFPMIVLRAKRPFTKQFYAASYNPDSDNQQPDCFSLDGIAPDPASLVKQCDSCANCPQNAFGSAKDNSGNARKGKACSDSKILAVFVPKFGINQFKIGPASLKNWKLYIKSLDSRNIPVTVVWTWVSFDATQSVPVTVFNFGGFIDESIIPALAEKAQSQETTDIVEPSAPAPAAKQVEQKPQEVAAQAQAQSSTAADLGLAPPKEEKQEPVNVAVDLGLGTGQQEASKETSAAVSDDDLRKQLGL